MGVRRLSPQSFRALGILRHGLAVLGHGTDDPGGKHSSFRLTGRLRPVPQSHDRVWTTGVNFYVTPHIVFKGDYQWFERQQGLQSV